MSRLISFTRRSFHGGVPNRYPVSIPYHNIRAVICSLDGVIMPSEPFIQKLQVAFMNKMYIPLNVNDVYNGLGKSIDKQIWDLLSLPSTGLHMKHPPMPRDILTIRTEFEHLVRSHFMACGVQWMPQVSCAIRTLQVNGILMACRTPLSDSLIGPIQWGMRKDYCPQYIVNDGHHPSATAHILGKWNNGRRIEDHILPNQVLHVGSTIWDWEEAKRVKMHFVGVTDPRMNCMYRPVDVTAKEIEQVLLQHGASTVMQDFLAVVNRICISRLS